jgi:hypothetical protein
MSFGTGHHETTTHDDSAFTNDVTGMKTLTWAVELQF